ncbi:MAG: glycine--tRNA ligase subunit beta [Bacillota bacterium]
MSKDFLLEIGTEEMPANDMDVIRKNFLELASDIFSERRLNYEDIDVYSTPRRLTLYIEKLATKQKDKKESVRGPAHEIAFDENGEATKAGLGFAKSQAMEVEELVTRDGYLYADKVKKGKNTEDILDKIILKLIKEVDFPKSMRWGNIDFKFIRPIKWLVAIFGEKNIDFEIAGVKSKPYSYGHRFLTNEALEINNAKDYFKILEENYIIVNQEKRKDMIIEQINDLNEVKGKVVILENLLSEVVELVEYPTAFCGSFAEEYLKIPDDVLITSMVEHQRYFPTKKENGNLDNSFVGVRDGIEDNIEIVKEGNEMVLEGRLADARFFFEEDQKKEFINRKKDLKDVVFKEGIGSIYEKVLRLEKLSQKIAEEYDMPSDKIDDLKRAAELSKNDLVTEMVNEFAKLQGIMGAEYAKLAGENNKVVKAIAEHYLPRFADDKLPESKIASILSIADKLDNIAAHYSLGIKASGSQDPYALRRQAAGVVKIILKLDNNISIDNIINYTLKELNIDDSDLANEIKELLLQRLKNELEEMDIRYDVISAVMKVNNDDFVDIKHRAQAVMKVREKSPKLFIDLFRALVRAKNLSNEYSSSLNVNEKLFDSKEEKKLYEKYNKIDKDLEKKLKNDNYNGALKKIVEIKKPIDKFLDNVIVMVDNEEIKNNRLALLQKVSKMASEIMDIEEIALDD